MYFSRLRDGDTSLFYPSIFQEFEDLGILKLIILVFYVGRMRCLAQLARWEELNNLCKEYWTPAEPSARLEMAPMVVF